MFNLEEPPVNYMDGNMSNRSLIDEIEQVIVSEVGTGGAILINQYLHELGLTRKTFSENHVPALIDNIIQEFDKVLGTHVNLLRAEINKKSPNGQKN